MRRRNVLFESRKKDIKNYQEFAFEVAAEHEEISKTSSKALKKATAAEETATKRLLKNKDAYNHPRTSGTVGCLTEHFRRFGQGREFEMLSYLAGRDLDGLAYHKVKKSSKS